MKNVAALICFVASLVFANVASAQAPEGGSTIDPPPPAASAPAGNPCGTDAGCNAALAQCRQDLTTAATASENLVAALAACTSKVKSATPPPKARPLPPPPTCGNGGSPGDTPDSYAIWHQGRWICVASDQVYLYIAGIRQDLNALRNKVPDLSQYNLYLTKVDNLTRLIGQPGPAFASTYADVFTWIESAEERFQRIESYLQNEVAPRLAGIDTLCPPVDTCGPKDYACRCTYAKEHNKGSRVDFSVGA